MIYILDWITCCCYMALRRIKYSETGAETTAVANTSLIVGLLLISAFDIILFLVSPELLQKLYHYGKLYYVATLILSICLIYSRYYLLRKDAISIMEERFKKKKLTNVWILNIIEWSILIFAFYLCYCTTDFIQSRGIVFK